MLVRSKGNAPLAFTPGHVMMLRAQARPESNRWFCHSFYSDATLEQGKQRFVAFVNER